MISMPNFIALFKKLRLWQLFKRLTKYADIFLKNP